MATRYGIDIAPCGIVLECINVNISHIYGLKTNRIAKLNNTVSAVQCYGPLHPFNSIHCIYSMLVKIKCISRHSIELQNCARLQHYFIFGRTP